MSEEVKPARARGPFDGLFEQGRVACDEPPGFMDREYKAWKEAGGKVLGPGPQEESPPPRFHEWCVLELMGHVRLAGRVTEEEHFGSKLGRIDVPKKDGTFTTQYFSGGSIYRLTPTTEEIARRVAVGAQPQPVHRFELPAPDRDDQDDYDRDNRPYPND